MRGIYDQLFKELAIAFPSAFLTLMMPEIAQQTDLSTVVFESNPEIFLDTPRGRRRFPDLVARLSRRGSPTPHALAHVEVEYSYRSKRVPSLRDYNQLLGLRCGLPVHTAVLYLHGGPSGLTHKVYEEKSMGEVLCKFYFRSLGLARSSAALYLKQAEPLAWAFAPWMLPKGIGSHADVALIALRQILAATGLDEARRFLLVNCVQTYVQSNKKTACEYKILLQEPENQEVREMTPLTWANKMTAEGHQKGHQEGHQEGRQEGMQELVMWLFTERFGEPSKRLRQCIVAITSAEELTRLAGRVSQAGSVEELGLV